MVSLVETESVFCVEGTETLIQVQAQSLNPQARVQQIFPPVTRQTLQRNPFRNDCSPELYVSDQQTLAPTPPLHVSLVTVSNQCKFFLRNAYLHTAEKSVLCKVRRPTQQTSRPKLLLFVKAKTCITVSTLILSIKLFVPS